MHIWIDTQQMYESTSVVEAHGNAHDSKRLGCCRNTDNGLKHRWIPLCSLSNRLCQRHSILNCKAFRTNYSHSLLQSMFQNHVSCCSIGGLYFAMSCSRYRVTELSILSSPDSGLFCAPAFLTFFCSWDS